MFSRHLAFGVVAVGCLAAAGAGAYLATRHNAADRVATAAAPESSPASHAGAVPAPQQAVAETESVVSAPDVRTATVPKASSKQPEHAAPAHAEARTSSKVEQSASAAVKRDSAPVAARTPERTIPLPDREQAVPVPNRPPVPADPVQMSPVAAPVTTSETAHPADATPPPPPAPQFDELVLPASSVIGLQLETSLSSEKARVEDRVEARVTRDVVVGGRVAIPAGARVVGSVTEVDRGGKMRERARLAIRFNTLVLMDGTEVALRTEPIMREGEAPAPDSAKKIGGAAIGGAILGAILGGGKGAVIGGMTGAGGGTAAVMAGDRNPAVFPAGAIVTARLSSPSTIEVERQ